MSESLDGNNNNPNSSAEAWDHMAEDEEKRRAKEQLENDLLNIDDMLRSGRITEEKAEHYRREVNARAAEAMGITPPSEAQPKSAESVEQDKEFAEFQVASGTTKEAEFERLTGEKWPGEKYYAVTYGVDEGYDEPIENWTIYERPSTEIPQQPEVMNGDEEFAKFQVASGTTKEAEFKRLTGEDWPGENYYAVTYGVDEGYDEPIENWTIYKRSTSEQVSPTSPEGEEAPEGEDTEKAKAEEVEKAKAVAIEKAKAEELEKLKAKEKEKERAEDLQKIRIKEEAKRKAEEEAARRRGKGEPEEDPTQDYDKPLAAINADFTEDMAELAHDYAEQQLNADVAKSGLIKRIWKGTLFKKYFQKKYEREILSGERAVGTDEEGNAITVEDVIERRSDPAIERFVKGATEEYGEAYIHTKAGEKLTEADVRTTEAVKNAIEWFATAAIPEGGSLDDLRVEFGNRIRQLQAEGRDNGEELDAKLINNYYEVAVQARERAEHGVAMDRVMEGFKVYNADVRNNIRTKVHRDNVDKIIDRIENSAVGSVLPPELVAAAVGCAAGITQRGARAIAGPVLGIGVSGVFAGLRERNRVTEDRARMARDVAVGEEYDSGAETGYVAGKRGKYETRLGGTLYETQSATELTDRLEQVLNDENSSSEEVIQAIAEARVRIDMSDSEDKDLISYSSADKLGEERLKLDIALIKAERSLSEEDRAKLENIKTTVQDKIYEDVDEKDQDFRKLRTAQALKQAGKTIAIGSITFFGSQEIVAAVDPSKIGLLEKAGILHTNNDQEASETILAGLAGPRVNTVKNVSGDELDKIRRLKKAGYDEVEVKAPWPETKQDLVDVRPENSAHRVKAAYDGWANNGTPRVYDGNELGIDLNKDGFVSTMSGNSTMNGQSFDYGRLSSAGEVKGYITIGNAKFEVASTIDPSGRMTWPIDADGFVQTTAGDRIPAIGSNGERLFRYFEVALDNGTDANGFEHIMPFATAVGENSFDGTIQELREVVVEHPGVYDFVKPREVFYGGVAVPVASRVGLGEVTSRSESGPEEPTPEEPTPEEPTPEEPTPEEPTPGPEETGESGETGGTPSTPPEEGSGESPTGDSEPEGSETPGEQEPGESEGDEPEGMTLTEEQPDQSPEDEAYRNSVSENLGDLIGEEGINIMTTKRGLGRNDSETISTWWVSLSDEAKQRAIETAKNSPDGSGTMFKAWLQMQSLL